MSNGLWVPVHNFFGAGVYQLGVQLDDDPLARLVNRVAGLDHADVEWADRLIASALIRKVREKARRVTGWVLRRPAR